MRDLQKDDYQKLSVLVELRETVGLRQDEVGEFFGLAGKKRRDSVSAWEAGRSRPRLARRSDFIVYLLDKLELRGDPQKFLEVWNDVAVAVWQWKPLTDAEWQHYFYTESKTTHFESPHSIRHHPEISATHQTIVNIFSNEAERRKQHDRQTILKRVKDDWVKGVLEQSLHKGILIELGFEELPNAVERPCWEIVLEDENEEENQTLPSGKNIVDVFDQMGHNLLILGEPGSGKTTILLELARDAIARAEQYPAHPIPIVFNLSSWTNVGQSIASWLIEELNSKYFIPKRIAREWIKNDELLLLLDGLDEVAAERREACIKAINDFHLEHLMPLVICSRAADYQALKTKLKLRGGILLQSLTSQQVDDYFARAGSELTTLHKIYQEDPVIQKLAYSPLMLNIMTLAYRGMPVEELRSIDTVELRLKHLFDTYIEQMFKRRGGPKFYSSKQAIHWLTWLAQKMSEQSQTIFLIERLQPSWLSTERQQRVYALVSRLSIGFSFGIPAGLSFWLSSADNPGEDAVCALLMALTISLGIGLVEFLHFQSNRKNQKNKQFSDCRLTSSILIIGLTVGLSVILSGILSSGLAEGLETGTKVGLFLGIVAGLIFGLRRKKRKYINDIQTTETFTLSWNKALRGAVCGLIGGLIVGAILGWVSDVNPGDVFYFSKIAIGFGLTIGLVTTVLSGLNASIVKIKTIPNQGIYLSARNAFFSGVGFGLITILMIRLLGFMDEMAAGLGVATIITLWYSGPDVIQHYVLRLILYYKGYTPWNYTHFLDYATERILLNKVGGGYIFKHRSLMEHFASLKSE